MVDFKAGYVPPGVYVSSDVSGPVGAVGIGGTVLCLVGEGLGYQINTEYTALTSPVPLAKLGVVSGSITVKSSADAGATVYVQGTDWSATTTGSGTETAITIARISNGAIASNATVVISYHYANDAYFSLNAFTDYSTFSDVYGDAYDPSTGNINSPLSLAAQLAFQNGANLIYAVAISHPSSGGLDAKLAAAYALTVSNFDINLMVPLLPDAIDSGSTLAHITTLATHLSNAADENSPRMGLIGVSQSFSGAGPDTVAASADNSRIVLFWPNQFLSYNPITRAPITLDGFYFAAGAAGVLASQSISRGLTRSQVNSFTGIPLAIVNNMPISDRNKFSAAGVAVAEIDRLGRLIIRHGVTTDVSSIVAREISIVRCRDALFDTIYQSLDQADLVGDPITDTTTIIVKGIVAGALEQALGDTIINAYTDLVVRQQALPTGDPTVIEVKFSYQPTYPLNYVTVIFTIDLQTGDVSATDTTAAAA